jgi:hypothetical protein
MELQLPTFTYIIAKNVVYLSRAHYEQIYKIMNSCVQKCNSNYKNVNLSNKMNVYRLNQFTWKKTNKYYSLHGFEGV